MGSGGALQVVMIVLGWCCHGSADEMVLAVGFPHVSWEYIFQIIPHSCGQLGQLVGAL